MLGMCTLLPLLDSIDKLVNFSQKCDIYICDFVAIVKVCQVDLYRLYKDKGTSYSSDEFWSFNNLLECNHEQIHVKWITNLNDDSVVLVSIYHGNQIHEGHKSGLVDHVEWAI